MTSISRISRVYSHSHVQFNFGCFWNLKFEFLILPLTLSVSCSSSSFCVAFSMWAEQLGF
jgi:hypothetical protein